MRTLSFWSTVGQGDRGGSREDGKSFRWCAGLLFSLCLFQPSVLVDILIALGNSFIEIQEVTHQGQDSVVSRNTCTGCSCVVSQIKTGTTNHGHCRACGGGLCKGRGGTGHRGGGRCEQTVQARAVLSINQHRLGSHRP